MIRAALIASAVLLLPTPAKAALDPAGWELSRHSYSAPKARAVKKKPPPNEAPARQPCKPRSKPMLAKVLEIRDEGTFIPVLAVDMNPNVSYPANQVVSEDDLRALSGAFMARLYLLRRCGYPCDGRPNILITHLSASGKPAWNDPYGWGGRTYPVAHKYIIEHPRLRRMTKYVKNDRSVHVFWSVDGETVGDLDEAAERLNTPPSLTDDERTALTQISGEYMDVRDKVKPRMLLALRDKGLIEFEDRKCRRRPEADRALERIQS